MTSSISALSSVHKLPAQSQPQAESWDVVEVSPIVDLRDIKSVILRRFGLLVAIPGVLVILALVYLYLIAVPLYPSTALVFIDPKFDRILQIEDVQSVASDLDSLNSLERAITSDSMMIRVIDRLDLRNDLGFLPKSMKKRLEKGKEISDSRLLQEIRGKRVSAALIRPTRLLELTVLDSDPVRAQKIAETFIEEFESFLGEQKRSEAGNSEKGLRVLAEEAYNRALIAEKQLENFRNENPEFTVEQDHQLFAERLSKVGEELNLATARAFDLQSRFETLKNIDPMTDPIRVIETGKFSELDQVANLLQQQSVAKQQFAIAKVRYTESNPSYKLALAQLVDVKSQLQDLAIDLKASVTSSLEAAKTHESLLGIRVKELQKVLSSVKSASSKFRAIQQKVETEWLVHQNFQSQIGQTSISTEKSTAITTLMSAPLVAHKAAKPSKPITVLAAGFLGLFIGFGVVATDLLTGGPFVNRRQAEEYLHTNAVAEVAAPTKDNAKQIDYETMRELSKVFYSPEHRQSRLIHISAVSDCPDGLRTSVCLASVSANHGCPTLLITVLPDDDPKGLVSHTPVKSSSENLYTLTLTPDFLAMPSNAWELVQPHCRNFQRIIIESTAMTQSSAVPGVLASVAESNLLIVSMQRDPRREVKDVVQSLSKHSRSPVALVLQG